MTRAFPVDLLAWTSTLDKSMLTVPIKSLLLQVFNHRVFYYGFQNFAWDRCQWHRPIVTGFILLKIGSTFASFQSTRRAPSASDFRYMIDSGHAICYVHNFLTLLGGSRPVLAPYLPLTPAIYQVRYLCLYWHPNNLRRVPCELWLLFWSPSSFTNTLVKNSPRTSAASPSDVVNCPFLLMIWCTFSFTVFILLIYP